MGKMTASRRSTTGAALATILGGLLLAGPSPLAGQVEGGELSAEAALDLTLVVGDASDFLDGGPGGFFALAWHTGDPLAWGVRVDGGWTSLDDDTDEGTGARAENDLILLTVGPSLGLALGPLTPWIAPQIGLVSSRWSTSSPGTQASGNKTATALGASGGLRIRLGGGAHPISLSLRSRILDPGVLQFGRAPSLVTPTQPTGVVEEDVALLSVGIGLVVRF